MQEVEEPNLREFNTICLNNWQEYGQRKIVVKVENCKDLIELEKKAKDKNIHTVIIYNSDK